MKRLHPLAATAIIAACLPGQALRADLITGTLSFVGNITLDTSSVGTATMVTGWIQPQISQSALTGTFATAPYTVATGAAVTCTSVAWNLNTGAPITNFWSVGGFTFELWSSQILVQGGSDPGENGYLIVQGTGVVSGNGFTPTVFGWSMTTSDPAAGDNPESWTFSGAVYSMNSNGAPVLGSQTIPNATILSWSDPTFALQTAPCVNGSYTNIPGATSPYTNLCTSSQQFFRLMQ